MKQEILTAVNPSVQNWWEQTKKGLLLSPPRVKPLHCFIYIIYEMTQDYDSTHYPNCHPVSTVLK